MVRSSEFENLKRRTIQLNIVLANDGTIPAEDIDIYLHFPDGFQLLEEYKLPNAPKAPKPPTEPMTEMQRMANSMSYASQFLAPNTPYTQSVSVESPQNVSSPSIKRIQSYEVHVHVQKIKHNLQEHLDPLFVVFDTMDYANSFTIDYRILTANIPHEVIGNLHVVVEKEDHL